jgi:hypothetical protein
MEKRTRAKEKDGEREKKIRRQIERKQGERTRVERER